MAAGPSSGRRMSRVLDRGSFSVMLTEKGKKRPVEPQLFARVEEFEGRREWALYVCVHREGEFRRLPFMLRNIRGWLRRCLDEVDEALEAESDGIRAGEEVGDRSPVPAGFDPGSRRSEEDGGDVSGRSGEDAGGVQEAGKHASPPPDSRPSAARVRRGSAVPGGTPGPDDA